MIEVADQKYDHSQTKQLIASVVELRDSALKANMFDWAVQLSHVIGWMNQANDLINGESK